MAGPARLRGALACSPGWGLPTDLPRSLPPSLPAAARGWAAGPTPGAAGRGRLPAGLSLPSPAPARGPHRPARALFPRRLGRPGAPTPFRDFLSLRIESAVLRSFLLRSLSPTALGRPFCPAPCSQLRFSPSGLCSRSQEPFPGYRSAGGSSRRRLRGAAVRGRRRRALRGAGARAGVPLPAERTDRPCPRNQEPGLTESSVQGNERGARASPAA